MQRFLLAFAASIIAASAALAHFPFILIDRTGAARLVMSETLAPDPDVGIDIVAGAKLRLRTAGGAESPITLTAAADHLKFDLSGSGTRVIHGTADLGVMKRGRPHLLVYYPKAIVGDVFDPSTVVRSPVELVPVRAPDGFKLRLVVDGKPVPNAPIRVLTPDGDQEDSTTDAEGLTVALTAPGRYGAWARHWIDQKGERDGQAYEQVRHYATLVFEFEASASEPKGPWAPLPRAMASFGAVECEGWLYVYGGHTAERHEYSTASVSGGFHRLNLASPTRWEDLPSGVAVQGMNLAAHAGKVYRVGGMEPRNAPGQPADNYSIADAAEFDPALGQWKALPPLPVARSSHELLAVDGSLMVIGGWSMSGKDKETQWPAAMDVLDLNSAPLAWRTIPQPFSRRALVGAAVDRRVYVIGGFDAEERAQLDVDIYDIASGSWSKGPPIPGRRRNGFAPGACAHNGTVYLSVGSGEMYRLKGSAWEQVATTTPRIVHRLVPYRTEILVIGGASEEKMVDVIESVPTAPAGR